MTQHSMAIISTGRDTVCMTMCISGISTTNNYIYWQRHYYIMSKVETIKYISLRVYGKTFDDISREQQINILDKRDSIMALSSMVADKNFKDLKRNGYISL